MSAQIANQCAQSKSNSSHNWILHPLQTRRGRSVYTNCDRQWKMGVSLHLWEHLWEEVIINDVETKGRIDVCESKATGWSAGKVHYILWRGRHIIGRIQGGGSDCEPKNLLQYAHPTEAGNQGETMWLIVENNSVHPWQYETKDFWWDVLGNPAQWFLSLSHPASILSW